MGTVRVSAGDTARHILASLQAGQTQKALAELDNALLTFSNDPDLLHLKAHALRQVGRLGEAIDAAQTALTVSPGNFEINNMLGNMLKVAGRIDEAETAFRTAIKLKPDYVPAHKNLVSLLVELGKSDEAVAAGEQFVRQTGERNADAFEALGRAFKTRKAWHKASQVFRQAMDIAPQHVAAIYGEASALVEIGETETARDLCQKLVDQGQSAPQILRLLARAEMELSDFSAAEPHLQKAVGAGSPDAVKDYANLLWMTGREHDAEALLHGAVSAADQRMPQAIAALDELLDMEKPEHVVHLFDRLSMERKSQPEFIARLASARGDMGEMETAFQLAETAFRQAPLNRVIAYQYIVSALMSARYDAALAETQIWRSREPLDQNWIALEADALRMLGRLDSFHRLYDYERFVIPAQLDVPNGYNSLEDFHADFIEQVHGSSAFKTHPLGQSARQGIQTPRNLVFDDRPVVKAYIEALHAPVRDYLAKIGDDADHPVTARNSREFYIGGCWSIYLLAGGRHVSHTHPKGWISSAYYMAVPPEAKEDTINRPGWIKFGEPPYKLPDPAPAEHWVCPEPGTLVLFPAYMWHGTVPISGKAPRVTAPLDVQPGVAP